MNALDPKIVKAFADIESVYAGKDSSHAYYDPKLKVYVLVVSGKEAEAYHKAVMAIHQLARNSRRTAAKRGK